MIQDIIFVFQGIDGHNIAYSTIEKMYVVKTPIVPPVRNILTNICEMGWLFRKINIFIEENQAKSQGNII